MSAQLSSAMPLLRLIRALTGPATGTPGCWAWMNPPLRRGHRRFHRDVGDVGSIHTALHCIVVRRWRKPVREAIKKGDMVTENYSLCLDAERGLRPRRRCKSFRW
ncbi:hypothetical protein Aple_075690 [Acrocarpospora pleiomorpha]|uniref:Uncharacterized protein n=1 Tax=Acrocarpospora pleiomorpha TaxID=90975 RepID=A0A5M3XUU8_9ACTN|nr:hypothetical protein Aple_075690 [Acrocarpospora pleiomorpha]